MRNIVSALCGALAAICMSAGVMLHYVQTLADQPEPAREIVGALADDKNVVNLLQEKILGAAFDQGSLQDLIPDFLKDSLREGMDSVLTGALSDPGFRDAWYQSIDETRASYVTRLEMMNSWEIIVPAPNFGAADTAGPTLILEARPFAALGIQKLDDLLRPVGLSSVVDGLRNGGAVEIPLNLPDPHVVSPRTMAWWLAVSKQWLWLYVAAVVLVLVGVLIGQGRGKAVSVLVGAAVLLILSRVVAMWASDARAGGDAIGLGGQLDPFASVVRDRLLAGLAGHLDIRAEWLWNAGLIGAIVGAVFLLLLMLTSRSRR
ncbi:hypothetical protein ACXA45_01780 [Neomicrococcus lactis]